MYEELIKEEMTTRRDTRQFLPYRSMASSAIILACFLIFFFLAFFIFPYRFLLLLRPASPVRSQVIITKSPLQMGISSIESSQKIQKLKKEVDWVSKQNTELKNKIKELTQKLENQTQHQFHLQQQKAGPFGTVRGLKTTQMVIPDESINPTLAKLLEKIAVNKELIIAIANYKVMDPLIVWHRCIKKVGIQNYLVIALDNEIARICKNKKIQYYQKKFDKNTNSIVRGGMTMQVSGLKFKILREFLQLGYSVLLSDTDVVHLQNPFDHIYRDSDIESMTDGHDNKTAYGYYDVVNDPVMGWSRSVLGLRIWVYNSGYFYIRPTIPSIELLDRVRGRVSKDTGLWDQEVFNEELFYPSYPGYNGLHASKRTMDFYKFMNSKVLFKIVRKNEELRKMKPVIVHVNYHPDKLQRMEAIVDFYVNGNQHALEPFPVGSE